jgi:hypothetical protein
MMVRVMKIALVATALVLLTTGTALAVEPSRLIQTNAKMQRLGTWRIDQSPTLGGARRALGEPSNCRRIRLEDGSVARWKALGVRVVTATLGVIPRGATSCSYDGMPVSVVRVTGRQWHTSLGLRVRDTVTKLNRLYPSASFHPMSRGDSSPTDSYWLVTRWAACLGDCGGARYVTAPQLVAQIDDGRVKAIIFPVDAQGE